MRPTCTELRSQTCPTRLLLRRRHPGPKFWSPFHVPLGSPTILDILARTTTQFTPQRPMPVKPRNAPLKRVQWLLQSLVNQMLNSITVSPSGHQPQSTPGQQPRPARTGSSGPVSLALAGQSHVQLCLTGTFPTPHQGPDRGVRTAPFSFPFL